MTLYMIGPLNHWFTRDSQQFCSGFIGNKSIDFFKNKIVLNPNFKTVEYLGLD